MPQAWRLAGTHPRREGVAILKTCPGVRPTNLTLVKFVWGRLDGSYITTHKWRGHIRLEAHIIGCVRPGPGGGALKTWVIPGPFLAVYKDSLDGAHPFPRERERERSHLCSPSVLPHQSPDSWWWEASGEGNGIRGQSRKVVLGDHHCLLHKTLVMAGNCSKNNKWPKTTNGRANCQWKPGGATKPGGGGWRMGPGAVRARAVIRMRSAGSS